MSTTERILKKINIGSVNFTPGLPGCVKTDLSRHDIAALLGMGNLSKPAYWFALAYYMADNVAYYNLEISLWDKLTEVSIEKKWRTVPGFVNGKTRNRILCEIALEQVFKPNICAKCKGFGYVKHNKDYCEECAGSGSVELSSRQYAKRLSIDKTQWFRTWSTRFHYAKQNLSRLIVELDAHVEDFKGN